MRLLFLSSALLCCYAQNTNIAQEVLYQVYEKNGGDVALPCWMLQLPNITTTSNLTSPTDDFVNYLTEAIGGHANTDDVSKTVPSAVRTFVQTASGVLEWDLHDNKYNVYFKTAFANVKACARYFGADFKLSQRDFYRGEVFPISYQGRVDVGILFEAMRHPVDGPTSTWQGSYSTSSSTYRLRNFLWLASLSKVFLLNTRRSELSDLTVPQSVLNGGDQTTINEFRKLAKIQADPFSSTTRMSRIHYFSRDALQEMMPTVLSKSDLFFFN